MKVSNVRYHAAPDHLVATGLMGWASFLYDGALRVYADVRRTRSGRLALSYPITDDGFGRRWPQVHPIDDAARVAIEREVLGQLDLGREVAR